MTTAKWLFGAALLLAACGSDGDAPQRTVFRDSAGIRIAENISPDDSAAHVWWTFGQPQLDIGGEDAVEPYIIHQVSAAIRQPDGSILVGSRSSADIRVFSAGGEHLRTTGRKGGGPGEFQSIEGFERAAGDSIYVFDQALRRMTLLEPDGKVARLIPNDPDKGFTRAFGRFADGSMLGSPRGTPVQPPGTSGEQILRMPVTLARFTPEGQLLDSLGSFPGSERVMRATMGANNQLASIEIFVGPFMKSPNYIASAEEFYIGAQDGPEIQVYDVTGALKRIIRTGRAPETVTQKHLDAHFERQLSQASPERREQMKASGRPTNPNGPFVPPYSSLMLDRTGNLWVSDYPGPFNREGRWTVYAPDGGVLARVQFPERFRPLDIGGDYVLGRELDDLDIEHVRLYPLIR